MSSTGNLKDIVVIGAGVIGLTTGLKLQETGRYRVTIVAEVLPNDPKHIKYTSHWAGAHHVTVAKHGTFRHAIEKETFEEMWKLSETSEAKECFRRIEHFEYTSSERDESEPNPREYMPEFRYLDRSELPREPFHVASGEFFHTVTIDLPVYLPYLLSRFLFAGGRILRGSVLHLSQIAENGVYAFLSPDERSSGPVKPEPPAGIVVCVGLGARWLGGVEDEKVCPSRGQTVLIRAPWINNGKTVKDYESKLGTFFMPRKSGIVILGGTSELNDWNGAPRADATRAIIERNLKLAPELVPPPLRVEGREPSVEDILPLVVEEACGFRPERIGGMRLEAGSIRVPFTEKQIPVVYNYGHGGDGYIASFGSARVVLELLEKALAG